MRIAAWTLLLLSLLFPPTVGAQNLEDSRKTLQEVQARIEAATRALSDKQAGARSLEKELKAVEADLAKLNRQIGELERRDRELGTQIHNREREAKAARDRVEQMRKLVDRRLVALYKEGEAGPMSILFSSRSPAHMAEEYDYMARVLTHDRQLLNDFRKLVVEAEAARARLEASRAEQRAVLAGVKESRAVAQEATQLKSRLLARTRQEATSLDKQVRELREQAAELAKLVKKLESEKSRGYTGGGVFSSLKGRLPWPVKGPVILGYGPQTHPELGTTFDSQGIEIGVTGDVPVKAVAEGRVVFANWFKGYGNLLILDHGDGYHTLYAHSARLIKAVGDVVKQGEPIAQAGLPGVRGIYFEVRRGGAPQDPRAWLGRP